MSTSPDQILIKRNEHGEYETPTGRKDDGRPAIYYASDLEDAQDTARQFHGEDCEFVVIKGTYGEAMSVIIKGTYGVDE